MKSSFILQQYLQSQPHHILPVLHQSLPMILVLKCPRHHPFQQLLHLLHLGFAVILANDDVAGTFPLTLFPFRINNLAHSCNIFFNICRAKCFGRLTSKDRRFLHAHTSNERALFHAQPEACANFDNLNTAQFCSCLHCNVKSCPVCPSA